MIEVSSGTIAIATVAVLLAFLLFSGFIYQPQFENPEVVFKEAPLTKNKELQLLDGEEYRYAYLLNESEVNITYIVMEEEDCTAIYLLESREDPGTCINRWGVDQSGSNSTFLNPTILLFKPWMLALHESWHWNNSMYLSFDGSAQHILDNDYRVIRTENYRGRMSYVVKISSSGTAPEYQWIDMEKRVLLRIVGEGYEVVLVEGLPLS